MPLPLVSQKLAQAKTRILNAASAEPLGRLLTWNHCYDFFYSHRANLMGVKDQAALHLGFYLGNWGMFRNSALIEKNHKFYYGLIDILAAKDAQDLHTVAQLKIANPSDANQAAQLVRTVAKKITQYLKSGGVSPTGTLVSKILLGTTACVPAFDTEARKSLESLELRSPTDPFGNTHYLEMILAYAALNRASLMNGMPVAHPPMQIFDLYLWL